MCIRDRDILHIDDVQELRDYVQHCKTTRLQHCVNVAYYTFLISRRLNLNVRSATRGALLHDFYLYDWKNNEQPIEGRHSVVHPQVALAMARQYTAVDPIMEDCILTVSYTHLDVYKRQAIIRPVVGLIRIPSFSPCRIAV